VKISLACHSILLEKALVIFLKNFIVPYKHCDFVISDKKIKIDKPVFCISKDTSDLKIPFSKSALLISLEEFYENLKPKECKKKSNDFLELERKISMLIENFKEELIQVIKEHYE